MRVSTAAAAERQVKLRGQVDWLCLDRVRFRVRQEYRCAYPGPVAELRQRLVILPPDRYGDQRLVAHTLDVHGADDAEVRSESDRFGNRVHTVASPAAREAVELAVDFTVERSASRGGAHLPADVRLAPYLGPTALTASCDLLARAADGISAEVERMVDAGILGEYEDALPLGVGDLGPEERRQWLAARRAGEWTSRALACQPGSTEVGTPAPLALQRGRGVAQDYAHLALALLRELRVPCRYVAGHVLGEGAPHAWVEAILADPDDADHLSACAYDPMHRRVPGLDYITVAVGRDYTDLAPSSGTVQGAAGKLTARRNAWVLEIE